MTSANLQNWYYVELTLKTKAAGTSSTLKLINRPAINATVGDYWPLLKNVSSVGSRMGEYLPQTFTGQIVLDNRPGTFGYERRLSDLLERNTIVDQSVKIYSAHVPINTDPYSSWSLAYVARAASWSLGEDGETLSISIDSQTIAKRVVTRVIDSLNFTAAPSASLGQHLPMVIGTSVEVKPLRINADASATPQWAYATTLGTQYLVGGVQTYYVKDPDGHYQRALSASNVATAVVDAAPGTLNPTPGLIIGSAPTAQRINITSTDNYIITQIELSCYGYNLPAGTYSGNFKMAINEYDAVSDTIGREIAATTVPKATYQTQMRTLAAYTVAATFDKPALLSGASAYYLVFYQDYDAADDVNIAIEPISPSATSTRQLYIRQDIVGNRVWQNYFAEGSSLSQQPTYKLFGVKFTDSTGGSNPLSADGLGYSHFEATQKTAISGYANPDISKLDVVVSINGILDDSGGTVTGGASAQITSPQHAIELLDKEWNGSTWTGGRLDNSKFSATHAALVSGHIYYRKIAGKTEGRTFLADLYNELCYNAGCRIALVNSSTNPLGTWAWGTETASSATITDEDGKILDVKQGGVETIVNRIQMYYDKRIKDVDVVTGSAQGEFRSYAKQIDWAYSTNSLMTALATMSATLYGNRSLGKSNFDWLNDTDSGETMAEYFVRTFLTPHWFVTFEVPFIKYRTLDMLDVVTLVHPALPAYFGTSANSHRPTYLGTEVDIAQGFYPKRANSYRAQIESKELQLFDQQFPTMKITGRILDNYPTDPT